MLLLGWNATLKRIPPVSSFLLDLGNRRVMSMWKLQSLDGFLNPATHWMEFETERRYDDPYCEALCGCKSSTNVPEYDDLKSHAFSFDLNQSRKKGKVPPHVESCFFVRDGAHPPLVPWAMSPVCHLVYYPF